MRQPFGQNFLVDTEIARQIVAAAEPSSADTLLEIGPGKGILTTIAAPLAGRLIAVEIDRELAIPLRAQFSATPSVEIVNQDFLSFPLPAAPYKVVANLPYSVATPIIEKILPDTHWDTIVVMVQKEVGERIAAQPRTKAVGMFSYFCNYYAQIAPVITVGPESFQPRPKVDSIVLRFRNRRPAPPDPCIFPLIRFAFQQRRKTILNVLSRTLDVPKPEILPALEASRIDPFARPETLVFEDYTNLTLHLKKYILSKITL